MQEKYIYKVFDSVLFVQLLIQLEKRESGLVETED